MVVSRVVEQHRFISHERIYFNAQLHTSHIHSTRSSSCATPLKDECFSFLDFVFVPWKPLQELRATQSRESSIKYIWIASIVSWVLLCWGFSAPPSLFIRIAGMTSLRIVTLPWNPPLPLSPMLPVWPILFWFDLWFVWQLPLYLH